MNADGFAFLILSPTSTHPFNGSVRQFSNFKGSCRSEKGAVDNREDELDSYPGRQGAFAYDSPLEIEETAVLGFVLFCSAFLFLFYDHTCGIRKFPG